MSGKITEDQTVQQNWRAALEGDNVVDASELARIIGAARKWGGVSPDESREARQIYDNVSTGASVARQFQATGVTELSPELKADLANEAAARALSDALSPRGTLPQKMQQNATSQLGELYRDVSSALARKLGLGD